MSDDENDILRALLAWGSDPCIYCGLPAADMGKCQSGFPGCGRADDMMVRPDKEGWTKAADQQGAAHE